MTASKTSRPEKERRIKRHSTTLSQNSTPWPDRIFGTIHLSRPRDGLIIVRSILMLRDDLQDLLRENGNRARL